MKKNNIYNKVLAGAFYLLLTPSLLLSFTACTVDDVKPQGTLDEETAYSSPDKLVTAAYAKLGNDTGYHPMEIFTTLQPDRGEFDELWYQLYSSISRCNRAIESLTGADGAPTNKQLMAEVRFLRAHFYYKLQQMWYEVPFITEGMSNADIEACPQSSHDQIMQQIIDDFQFAYENLAEAAPGTTGRAHKVAAAAYLAKCYLNWAYGDGYEANTGYSHVDQAKIQKVIEYTEVVKNADDGTKFGRANWSNMLNGVWGIWSCGWDFHKPSQNLVNAFKTRNGLPMDNFDEDHNAIVINGADTKYKYDPRLFHTVGMPTYPYKYEAQYTLTKANSRTPNTYGYYCSMKEVPQRSKGEDYDMPWQAFGVNDYVLRYTDVMLMRAEALIEKGDLNGEALQIINDIRSRAKKDISATSLIGYAKDPLGASRRAGHGRPPLLRPAPLGPALHHAQQVLRDREDR